MSARLGCVVVGLALAPWAMAEEAPRRVVDTSVLADQITSNADPYVEPGIQPAGYDVIIVPRPQGASRSRLWTERGWVTLPAAPQGLPRQRFRNSQSGWNQYPHRQPWSTRRYGERNDVRPNDRWRRERASDGRYTDGRYSVQRWQ